MFFKYRVVILETDFQKCRMNTGLAGFLLNLARFMEHGEQAGNSARLDSLNTRKEDMEKLHDSLHPTRFDNWENYIGPNFSNSQLLVLLARNRDSDCLSESNFEMALERLGGESETVQIIRIGHWAVGWIEYLCVLAGSPAEAIAQDIENALSDYPVLNEIDLSEREQACANQLWQSWPVSWRLEWLRDNRDEYRLTFPELLSAARGSFFPGYPGNFIY